MSNIENNKLIAEFYGLDEHFFISENVGQELREFNDDELRFDTSWDWLMPVVEKIEETEVNGDYAMIIIQQGMCEIEMYEYMKEQKDGEELRVHTFQGSKIEATYQAVVSFIKWYNLQPSKFICGSCGEYVNEYTYNEEKDIDECNACK
jgi:hypothetical protein